MRIISGGQTGVDRAALDVALERGMSCGGWCPRGRRAEDEPLPASYPMQETPSSAYAQRTGWNVRDSDGTLVLNRGELLGGTAETVEVAARLRKPVLVLDLDSQPDPATVHAWLAEHRIRVLNIAGPRESKRPGIYHRAAQFLRQLFGAGRKCQTLKVPGTSGAATARSRCRKRISGAGQPATG